MESFSDRKKEKNTICPKCFQEIEQIQIYDRWITPMCKCEAIEIIQREREEQQREELTKRIESFAATNLKIQHMTFENFEYRPLLKTMLEKAKAYSSKLEEMFAQGDGLVFLGNPGVGKSHISAAIINTALKQGYSCIYECFPDLLARLRSTYGDNGEIEFSEAEIYKVLFECDFLVLDDLGAEKHSVWTESVLYTIVNKRYMSKRPMILSTNLSFEMLQCTTGTRTFDRLVEMCTFITCMDKSYRAIKAKQRSDANGGL
jgi:DNA replication protein DnaC